MEGIYKHFALLNKGSSQITMNVEFVSKEMRKDILRMAYNCGTGGAHIGGSMSVVEILSVLYTEVMCHKGDIRDRFIMSKAHAVIALYAALHQVGKLTDCDIENAMKPGSILFKHPCMNVKKGIEFSGGSLGHGLSLGVGTALALKMKKNSESRVYVMLGDGECDEGAIWEAAACASHYKLDNLTVIIDQNGLQNDGTTKEILDFSDMPQRWKAFGFYVQKIDGHNVEQIRKAFEKKSNQPKAIVAKTIKGKGVSFAENVVDWHAAYLTKELFDRAIEELENGGV